jgi:hypothetical protein
MFSEDVTYAANELKKLVGGTIVATTITEDKESYGFVVERKGKRTTCWVDCDPEGNGPGWIQMEGNESVSETASG